MTTSDPSVRLDDDDDRSGRVRDGASTTTTSARAPSGNTVAATTVRRPGTRPWTGGATLVSTGHRELDAVCGGGQPLGTVVLIEEDRWSEDLGVILARYWAAEAVAQGQILLSPATRADAGDRLSSGRCDDDDDANDDSSSVFGVRARELSDFVESLPRDAHEDKFRRRAKAAAAAVADDVGGAGEMRQLADDVILEEDEDDNDEEDDENKDNDEGLRIAWQYRADVQRQRSGMATTTPKSRSDSSSGGTEVFCHSYDLNDTMLHQYRGFDEHDDDADWRDVFGYDPDDDSSSFSRKRCVDVVPCAPLARDTDRARGHRLARVLLDRAREHLDDPRRGRAAVVRVLLLNAPPYAVEVTTPLLVSYVRDRRWPVAVLITTRPWLREERGFEPTSSHADVVFSVRGLSFRRERTSAEFRDLAGLLSVRRAATSSDRRRPPADRYGMKRDRRKVVIEPLHLPPEEFSSGGGSVGGGGVRSGAGRTSETRKSGGGGGCGSAGGALDF